MLLVHHDFILTVLLTIVLHTTLTTDQLLITSFVLCVPVIVSFTPLNVNVLNLYFLSFLYFCVALYALNIQDHFFLLQI